MTVQAEVFERAAAWLITMCSGSVATASDGVIAFGNCAGYLPAGTDVGLEVAEKSPLAGRFVNRRRQSEGMSLLPAVYKPAGDHDFRVIGPMESFASGRRPGEYSVFRRPRVASTPDARRRDFVRIPLMETSRDVPHDVRVSA